MPTFKLTEKLFLTSSFMHFDFIFSEYSRPLFPKRLWKWASTISFRKYKRKIVLLVIYLFNYDSSKSTFLMLNMAIDVMALQEQLFFCSVFWCKFFKKVIVLHHGDNNFLFYFDICKQIHTFNYNLKDEEMITSH